MAEGRILVAEQDGVHVLKFLGDVRLNLCPSLDLYLDNAMHSSHFRNVLIDLTETQGIDSTSLGILAKLAVRMRKQMSGVPTLVSINNNITRILLSMGFDKVFALVNKLDANLDPCEQLINTNCTEQEMQEKVLEAHRTLMALNEKNQQEFKSLVDVLESQCQL
ncbi:MAG: STAS domain-containing protein [Gammaproteobacteria bacterium]|jgi:anti-anti-sigma factor|nr:STAS domain-containing protein [Gammaproteobacteria bacterium]MDP6166924.1 STAS domain-containing protein [Gammaproteobacteria bacterium]